MGTSPSSTSGSETPVPSVRQPALRLVAADQEVGAATTASADPRPVVRPAAPSAARVAASRSGHPAGSRRPERDLVDRRHLRVVADLRDDTGSLVAEYGLLVVLGATITMLATKWATGGAIWELFGAVLSRARALVGA